MEEEEKNKKTEVEKKENSYAVKTTILIISIVIFLSAFAYFRGQYNAKGYDNCPKCDTQSSSKKDNTSSSSAIVNNQVKIDDKKVTIFKSLFEFEKKDSTKKFPSIYSKKIINANDLSNEHKLSIAFNQHIVSNAIEDNFATCEELENSDFDYVCSEDDIGLVDDNRMIRYRLDKENMESAFYQIFDKNIAVTHQSFTTQNNISCDYNNVDYLCFKNDLKIIGVDSASYISKAIEYNDRLEVYVKYVWVEGINGYSSMYKEDTLFSNYYPNPAVSTTENIKSTHDDLIPFTKFTFLKNDDGTYYWKTSEYGIKNK